MRSTDATGQYVTGHNMTGHSMTGHNMIGHNMKGHNAVDSEGDIEDEVQVTVKVRAKVTVQVMMKVTVQVTVQMTVQVPAKLYDDLHLSISGAFPNDHTTIHLLLDAGEEGPPGLKQAQGMGRRLPTCMPTTL